MVFTNYFFSGNKYIRVSRNDTGSGSVDPGYNPPQPITNWQWPGKFGTEGIDAALYSGSKCYFFSGAEYVRVTRNTTVNAGQQDFTAPHPISEWGWGSNFGVTGIDAALWSGPVTYFFSGTQYIRVSRTSDSDLGTVDSGYPQPISNWNFPPSFGINGIKGALYGGSVCYFFDGGNYIRVQRGLEGAGFVGAGYPRAIKDVWGWPDGFGANGIDAALYSGGPLVPQTVQNSGNNGNNNYFLWDNGNPLLGVQATVNIDETFISVNQGFSFQLNCWSQEGANVIPNWQQFIIWDAQGGTVLGAQLDFFIAPDENDNKHEIIRLLDSLATVPVPTTIGQGYQLQWALTYSGNNVTGCIFTVLTKTGATLGSVNFPVIGSTNFLTGAPLTAADTAPIVAIQFSIGGEVGDGQGSIVAGAAGTITYTATNPLTILTGIPGPVTFRGGTGENANIIFGPLPSLAHTTITQGFCATPVPPPGFGSGA